MFKRFDKYVARANDDNGNDELLQEEIYVPEVTRNGMLVSEVEDLAAQEEQADATYTCSICPGRVMRSMKEVRKHVAGKNHQKRERMPDQEVHAAKKQREQDERLASATEKLDDPRRLSKRRKKLASAKLALKKHAKRLAESPDDCDLFEMFDELLHLLDARDARAAVKARQMLEETVCPRLSAKERVLKCGAALAWYTEGPAGVGFLLEQLASSFGQLEPRRAQAEAPETLIGVRRALQELGEAGRLAPMVVALCEQLAPLVEADAVTSVVLEFADAQWDAMEPEERQKLARFLGNVHGAELAAGGDGRLVFMLLEAVRHGAGMPLLRCCVLSPLYCLELAAPCITGALKEFAQQEGSARLQRRAKAAAELLGLLVRRCEGVGEQHLATIVAPLLESLIDYCVRCPIQEDRSAAWDVVEAALSRLTPGARMQALAQLLETCPFGTATALLIARVKNELAGDWSVWWPVCEARLFGLVFRVPKDSAELTSRHDAVMAALNLLLFLTIKARHMSAEVQAAVQQLRSNFLPPLEQLLMARIAQARLPVSVEHQNKLMSSIEVAGTAPEAPAWTEQSLKEAQDKTLVQDELTVSVIRRIESFSS